MINVKYACGFEIGNLSQCNSTAGSPTCVTSSHMGTYGAQLAATGDTLNWTRADTPTVTYQIWAKVMEDGIDAKLIDLTKNSKHIFLRLYQSGSAYFLELNVDGTSVLCGFSLLATYWNCYMMDLTTDAVFIRVNNIDIVGLDVAITGNVTQASCINNSNATLLVDDFTVVQGESLVPLYILPVKPALDRFSGLSGAGQNALLVNDVPPGDATYVYSTATNSDSYWLDNFVQPSGYRVKTLEAVNVVYRCYQTTNNTDSRVAPNFYVVTYTEGTHITPTTSAATYSDIWLEHPSWGAWEMRYITGDYADTFGIRHEITGTAEIRTTTYLLELVTTLETDYGPQTPGGFDLTMTMPAISADTYSIQVLSNYIINYWDSRSIVAFERNATDDKLKVVIYRRDSSGNQYVYWSILTTYDANLTHTVRVVYHDVFISVWVDKRWITSCPMATPRCPSAPAISLKPINWSPTVTNVKLTELSDWREAVYVDLESTGQAAISSLTQERPVDVYPRPNGSLAFLYDNDTTPISIANVKDHSIVDSWDPKAGSDFIVYYENIETMQYTNYADDYGFATRVLRLSNCEHSATLIAKKIADRAMQNMRRHEVRARPDIQVEPGDTVRVQYTLTGTGTAIDDTFLVEDVSIQMTVGNNNMILSGREVA